MRDPARIPEILETLRRAWEKNPDFRLGQIIGTAAAPTDTFFVEDDVMLAHLRSMADA